MVRSIRCLPRSEETQFKILKALGISFLRKSREEKGAMQAVSILAEIQIIYVKTIDYRIFSFAWRMKIRR